MMHRLLPVHVDSDLIYVDAETSSMPTDELPVDIDPSALVVEANEGNPESVSFPAVDHFFFVRPRVSYP